MEYPGSTCVSEAEESSVGVPEVGAVACDVGYIQVGIS
jgi:hypothetical protein